MKRLFLLLLSLLASAVSAQELRKEKFNLGPWEDEIGYAQAVRVGNTLYVSGSTGTGSMPEAIKGAFDLIKHTLAAYHLELRHVVKETIYTTDIEALKAAKDVRKAYYGSDFPAATWIQISRLYEPTQVIEVEVVAVFPEEAAKAAAPR